jgi:energy-coupling factor transporter ATP-binding protein EcfA2
VARVFVSYASEDIVLAGEVRRWLDDDHHEVFLAQDVRVGIAAGEEWRSRLHERLRAADVLVCVVTSAYVASSWCTAEVAIAQSRGSRLLPILAEPGVVHPLLSDAQHIELTGNRVDVRVALTEALRRVDARGGWGWPDDRSPFPGLRPLDVEDHRVFFGRNDEVEQLAGLLRSPVERAEGAVLVVVGPSGCGKSSLVRAGLLHVMAGEPGWWTLPPILPGADPVAAVVRELAATANKLGLGWTVAEVGHRVEDGGLKTLADELLLAARARRLLVVVDQFEEVLTQATTAARAHFAGLLHPVVGGPVQLVATLRPEFLDQLLSDTDLAGVPTHLYPVRPLRRDALRTVIEGPCRLAGIGVDDELVARLVADTDSGEALPLLAFTLAQLAEGVTRGGQLSPRRYDQIGGVRGALSAQADTALADARAASGRGRAQVIAELLRLVTVDEQGRPTRWRVPRDELPGLVIRELDAFVRRRLLTTDTDDGSVVVGVAHEAFLSAWSPLAQAIEENASALRARRAVEQAATEWDNEGRAPIRLWERGQLAAAVADTGARIQGGDLVTDRVELSPTARIFLRTSIWRDRLRRGRAISVLSVLLVLAPLAAGFAVIQQRVAEQQRDVAVSRQLAGQAEELRGTNPALGAQLSLAAYRLAPITEARSSILSTFAAPYATRLTGHTSSVFAVAFSPGGRILATGSDDDTARLWDVRDPTIPRRWAPSPATRAASTRWRLVLTGASWPRAVTMTPRGCGT